jgi:hypothetical protein
MPLLTTRGAAAAVNFGFLNAQSSDYWVGIFNQTSLSGGAVAVDADGGIYLCNNRGVSSMTSTTPNSVVKVTPKGQLIWKQEFQGSSTNYPTAISIALHPTNGIYVTGNLTFAASGSDIPTLYAANVSASGVLVWQAAHSVASNATVRDAKAVAGDLRVYTLTTYREFSSLGTISSYLASRLPNVVAQDSVVVGLDSGYAAVADMVSWGRGYTGALAPLSFTSVAQAASGNIYCVGVYEGFSGEGDPTSARMYLVKVSSAGALIWQRELRGTVGLQGLSATGVAVDAAENIYVCGDAQGGILACLDSSGTLQWANRFTYSGGSQIDVTQVAVSGSTLLVTGQMRGETKPFYARVPTSGAATGATVVGGYTVVYSVTTVNVTTPTYSLLNIGFSTGSSATITTRATTVTVPASSATYSVARL